MSKVRHETSINIASKDSVELTDTEVADWLIEMLNTFDSVSVDLLNRPWNGNPDWEIDVRVSTDDEAALGEWMFADAQGFIAGQYSERTVLD